MKRSVKRWMTPSFLLDTFQVLVFTAVGIVLALDVTGIWGISWLSANLNTMTLIAVCILIVSTFLERRVKLEGIERRLDGRLDKIQYGQTAITQLIQENQSPGIKLQDGQDFPPLETRLAQAKEVQLLGFSLVGIIIQYGGFFLKKA